MISVALDASAWTLIASGPIANILLEGIPGGWSVAVGSSAPAGGVIGVPVVSTDGSWSSNALAAGDNVYARTWGAFAGIASQTLSGMKN